MNRGIALAAAAVVLASSPASAIPTIDVDWSKAFAFETSGGVENPVVLVGFNPQPEPPGDGVLDLSIPTAPKISHDTANPSFRILFGMGGVGPLTFSMADAPDPAGATSFDAMNAAGSALFTILFEMTTTGGGVPDPLSWVGFNPQPEPPGADSVIGFDFEFDSLSIASLRFQILDNRQESLLSFTPTQVAEPGIAALLLLSGLGLVRGRAL